MLYAHCRISGKCQLVVINHKVNKQTIYVRRTFKTHPVGDPIKRHIRKHGVVIHGYNTIRRDWMQKTVIFLIGIISLVFVNVSCADDKNNTYIQKSYVDPRVDVIEKNGEVEGTLQKSLIDPRRTIKRDKDGNIKGYWQKSYVDPRKRVFIKKEN